MKSAVTRWLGFAVGVSIGCGKVGNSVEHMTADAPLLDASVFDADSPDGPPPDAGTVDAPPPPCDLSKPFGAPVLVAGVNSTAEENQASMSWDELTIYVSSTRAGGPGKTDLYSATRTSKTGAFGALSLVTTVSSAAADESPSLSKDGLNLYLASTRATEATFDLYVAARPTTAAVFGQPALIAGLNTTDHLDGSPNINGSGTVLYFDSDRSLNREIYRATRPNTNVAFGAPTLIGELNLPAAEDKYPVVSGDERSIYFASDRAGGVGGLDVWEAHRSTTSDGFGTPKPATNLNTTATDLPVWVSPDNCRILVSSDRAGGTGGRDIYLAARPQ